MRLRRQLLLVSLLLLSLPWAGCQFVREIEGALQSGQEQSLLATTQAIATVLQDRPELLYTAALRLQDNSSGNELYATSAPGPVIVDGYADGWEGPPHGSYGPVDYRAVTRAGRLFLLFSVRDSDVVYQDPRLASPLGSDHLMLRTAQDVTYQISTSAPGPIQARYRDASGRLRWDTRLRGQWQDTLEGYTIELEMPLELPAQRLGFWIVDASTDGESAYHGTIEPGDAGPAPWLIYPPRALRELIAPLRQSGLQLAVVDRERWLLSGESDLDQGPAGAAATGASASTPWLLRLLYRTILQSTPLPQRATTVQPGRAVGRELQSALAGKAESSWYAQDGSSQRKLLRAAAPVSNGQSIIGAVITQQSSERYLSLTDKAFNSLLYYSLLALTLTAFGLLGYASFLSWRIHHLSRAAIEALGDDGRLTGKFPVSNASDEIGELSRHYAHLLGQLHEYTEYLRTLSRKLSHELRTPIAVIQTSLENLESADGDNIYLERARQGVLRLSRILSAMSEANRLEESIHNNTPEEFDLVTLCADMTAAYSSIYTAQKIQFSCRLDTYPFLGVPDLLVQMLDKLVDNAASFTPPGGRITLSLIATRTGMELAVLNEGPGLPDAMQGRLFDSMVSIRESSEDLHLGLGLHIARLIAQFHGGSLLAENTKKPDGVAFRFRA